MKIVIQTGHVLDRSSIEEFLRKAPASWTKAFDTVVVYASPEKELHFTYHPTNRNLGIHIPHDYKQSSDTAIESVAVAVQAIEAFGHVPDKLSRSKEGEYRLKWRETK